VLVTLIKFDPIITSKKIHRKG